MALALRDVLTIVGTTVKLKYIIQGDHSPDNVKFPDNSLTVRSTRRVNCYSHHARTPTKYMYGRKYAAYNKQF